MKENLFYKVNINKITKGILLRGKSKSGIFLEIQNKCEPTETQNISLSNQWAVSFVFSTVLPENVLNRLRSLFTPSVARQRPSGENLMYRKLGS